MDNTKTSFENVLKIMKMVARKLKKEGSSGTVELPSPQELLKKGFHYEDIETAMRCLAVLGAQVKQAPAHRSSQDAEHETKRDTSLRQLHMSEAIRLAPEAQQMLVGLLNSGQITPLHFERTMEYLWQHDLREVSKIKLELILDVANPFQASRNGFTLSDRVPRPMFVN